MSIALGIWEALFIASLVFFVISLVPHNKEEDWYAE